MLEKIKLNYSNFRSKRIKDKLIVFESDDWGSIRMPSTNAFNKLIKYGIRVDLSDYDRLDILENRSDLEALFDMLDGFKDDMGNNPIFTLNTVLANPDFEKIKKNHFEHFYFEHFFDSYKNYYGDDLQSIWFKGVSTQDSFNLNFMPENISTVHCG